MIDKSIMYYSNKAFSGVLRGAGGRHVESFINLLHFDETCENFVPKLYTHDKCLVWYLMPFKSYSISAQTF